MSTMGAQQLEKIVKSEDEWRRLLSPERFLLLRKEGTEPAFQNKYWNNHDPGTYVCAGCRLPLFSSDDKFESGTGWPSFKEPMSAQAVETKPDDGSE